MLTLHECSLLELVDFSSEKEDKTRFSKLSKLTVSGNSNLESLKGIENCKELVYLIANNCNLKDISSLKDYFPQGMLLKINERGTVENFVLNKEK